MTVDLAPHNAYGLALRTPLIAAAGSLGYGVEYARLLDLNQFGAIVTRSITLHPRAARRGPRLIETPAGVLVSDPGSNPGLARVLRQYAVIWAGWQVPVVISAWGESPDEYAHIAAALEEHAGIAGVELRLSGTRAHMVAAVTATRSATRLPLLAKLPPGEPELLIELAQALVAAGADALVVTGAPPGLHVDPRTGERVEGYLCGPATLPLGLRCTAAVAGALEAPVVGCGGVASADDARCYLGLGAAAVQIGSALLADPFLADQINRELSA